MPTANSDVLVAGEYKLIRFDVSKVFANICNGVIRFSAGACAEFGITRSMRVDMYLDENDEAIGILASDNGGFGIHKEAFNAKLPCRPVLAQAGIAATYKSPRLACFIDPCSGAIVVELTKRQRADV